MIEDFFPEWDEAAAFADETRWAQRQADRDANACEVCNTNTTPHDLTNAEAETLDRIDEDFFDGLRDR